MESAKYNVTVDVIRGAFVPWGVRLEQDCLTGIAPFAMEQTARAGP
jgi:hypothetical protein